MDTLNEAKSFMSEAASVYAEYPDSAQVAIRMAQAYAAIAQAEATERVACTLATSTRR